MCKFTPYVLESLALLKDDEVKTSRAKQLLFY